MHNTGLPPYGGGLVFGNEARFLILPSPLWGKVARSAG